MLHKQQIECIDALEFGASAFFVAPLQNMRGLLAFICVLVVQIYQLVSSECLYTRGLEEEGIDRYKYKKRVHRLTFRAEMGGAFFLPLSILIRVEVELSVMFSGRYQFL